MADWTFVGAEFTKFNDGAAIGDITLTVPTGLAVGDLLIANIFRTAGGGASSATWTLRNSSANTGQVLTRPVVDAADLAALPASYVFDWLGTMDAAGVMSAWRPASGVTMSLTGATASGTGGFTSLTLPATETIDDTFDMAGTKFLIMGAAELHEIGATDVSITADGDFTQADAESWLTPDGEGRISAQMVQFYIDTLGANPDISTTFDAVGETGTVQCDSHRLAIAYTGEAIEPDTPEASPASYMLQSRRIEARELPHMVTSRMFRRPG